MGTSWDERRKQCTAGLAWVDAEQSLLNRDPYLYGQRQQEQVRAAQPKAYMWTSEVRVSLRQVRVPKPELGPRDLGDLLPGDVVLVGPEKCVATFGQIESCVGKLIKASDWLVRAASDWANAETLRDALGAWTSTPPRDVTHAAVAVRSNMGDMLILSHTPESGSKLMTIAQFRNAYGNRALYVARPMPHVDGKELWTLARDAALLKVNNYGLFGDNVVYSESAGVAVAKAAGLKANRRRILPVDITPGDFFDDDHYYFVVSVLK